MRRLSLLVRVSTPTIRAAVLFAGIAIVTTWPLSLNLASHTWSSGPDTALFVWTLGWDVHALTHAPWRIFDANIYHPFANTLAYSENLIGSALVAAPAIWSTGSAVVGLNTVMLASVLLCGLGAFVLARRLHLGLAAAYVTGVVFACAPPRFYRTGQLHQGPVEWIPFALAALLAYLGGGRRRDLWIATALCSWQALTSGHTAAYAGLSIAAVLGLHIAGRHPIAPLTRLRDFGLVGAALLSPTVLVYLPYRRAQIEMGLRRSLENWETTPGSFVASDTHVHRWILHHLGLDQTVANASALLFPGLIAGLLLLIAWGVASWETLARHWPSRSQVITGARRVTIATSAAVAVLGASVAGWVWRTGPLRLRLGDGLVISTRTPLRPLLVAVIAAALTAWLVRRTTTPAPHPRPLRRAHQPAPISALGLGTALTVIGVWISLGPPLGLWPLLYDLPGFSFVRVPSRFFTVAILGIALLAGAGLQRCLTWCSRRVAAVCISAVCVGLAVEYAACPLPMTAVSAAAPAADHWLATVPGPVAVAEFPLPRPSHAGAFERRQTLFMVHSMAHWHPTVHGYSGLRPPFHDRLYAQMLSFPDPTSLDALAQAGVTHVVVHGGLFDPGGWSEMQVRLDAATARLVLRYADGMDRVYALTPRVDSSR